MMSENQNSKVPVVTHVAALSVEIRTPLAQAELAASQLYREALTPNGRALAERIFEAVSDIDDLVERMLRVLVPRASSAEELAELAPVVERLHRRFSPALAACGVRWMGHERVQSTSLGDPELVRSLCTELLHLALALCGTGGRFKLTSRQPSDFEDHSESFARVDDSVADEDHLDITLCCGRPIAWSPPRKDLIEFAATEVRARALEAGGAFRMASSKRMTAVRIRIPIRPRDSRMNSSEIDAISENGPRRDASCLEY